MKKEFKVEYTYNSRLDILNIEITDKYAHKKTIELTFGVFLDFDENLLQANLEIISASKVLGLKKEDLTNPCANVNITIGKDTVDVEAIFNIRNENESVKLKALNEFEFPNSQTSFALV